MDKKGLRGNQSATIDDKGRLKVPTAFRALIEEQYGGELYLTSLFSESMQIYPMSVWLEVEARVQSMPPLHEARLAFEKRANYFGQEAAFDAQGRLPIPWRVRESVLPSGEVDVLGSGNYLDVWPHDRIKGEVTVPVPPEIKKVWQEFKL